MNYKIVFRSLSAFALIGAFLGGCSKKSSTTSTASFKVQLSNANSLRSLSDGLTPMVALATSLTAKLGGVDLIAECAGDTPPGTCLDSGLAPDPDIWVNQGCNNDISQCTTSNTEYFELIDPTAANTELNSQGRSIEPGTFTKVRIYLLNNDLNDAVQCNGVANATRPGVPITVTLPTSITVAAGESVTVTLTYDTSAADCSDDSTISAVFSGMTATATKN